MSQQLLTKNMHKDNIQPSQSTVNHHNMCSSHKICNQGHTSPFHHGQIQYLIKLLQKKYISPYKIIYMINQQQADYFKVRNQKAGCCSSSSITIPKHQMTKAEFYLSELISQSALKCRLNELLEYFSGKFQNVVKSGQKQNLKVDDQVQKFLIDKVVSEGINMYLYRIVVEKLKSQNQSINSSPMLWATPNTWYGRYPKIPLNFLSSQVLSKLCSPNKGYGIHKDFLDQFKQNLFKQLSFLQMDGKFQQLLWKKDIQCCRNDTKLLSFPQNYAIDGNQNNYQQGQLTYPYLKRSLLTLRSIPFELNAKANLYCTISENNQISYFKQNLFYKAQSQNCKFMSFCSIGGSIQCQIQPKNTQNQSIFQMETLKEGDLLIVDSQINKIKLQSKSGNVYLLKSWITTLQKIK